MGSRKEREFDGLVLVCGVRINNAMQFDNICKNITMAYERIKEGPMSRDVHILRKGACFFSGYSKLASKYPQLKEKYRLDVIRYHMTPNGVFDKSSWHDCVVDRDGVIYCGDEEWYICTIKDLYNVSDTQEFFMVDFGDTEENNLKLMAGFIWRYLDSYIGDLLEVDRGHFWRVQASTVVPRHLAVAARQLAKNPKALMQMRGDFHFRQLYKMVSSQALKDALRSSCKAISVLDE